MQMDQVSPVLVAWIVAIGCSFNGSCRRTEAVEGPGEEPAAAGSATTKGSAPRSGKGVIGEYCPAIGTVAPWFATGVQWSDDADDIDALISQFGGNDLRIYASSGAVSGAFTPGRVVDMGQGRIALEGQYKGAQGCDRIGTSDCGCGIALGMPNETPSKSEPVCSFSSSGEDLMSLTLDKGDPVGFRLRDFLDDVRAPQDVKFATGVMVPECNNPFLNDLSWRILQTGAKPDSKGVIVKVVAFADVDGNGSKELILSLQYEYVRTIAVYRPTRDGLSLIAETTLR